jgi:hypothetical protein
MKEEIQSELEILDLEELEVEYQPFLFITRSMETFEGEY